MGHWLEDGSQPEKPYFLIFEFDWLLLEFDIILVLIDFDWLILQFD